jgi:hypothetical protein
MDALRRSVRRALAERTARTTRAPRSLKPQTRGRETPATRSRAVTRRKAA